MFSFKRGSNQMQTTFEVYRNGQLILKERFNYDVTPQKLKRDMEERDGFHGPLIVIKKPMIKAK
jgi:hypothetical protein